MVETKLGVDGSPAMTAHRVHPLSGRAAGGAGVTIAPAEPAVRLSLRARPDAVGALSAALGVALPTRPKTSSRNGDRHALWLGPDEWLVLELGTLDPLAALASASVLHSAVDVSHRNTAVIVSGPMAAAVINAGCPLDLAGSAFPVGACTRTILGKAEIVLYRTGAETFRVECWRSFSDYVMTYLSDAARGV